jgi:hypothetical protein
MSNSDDRYTVALMNIMERYNIFQNNHNPTSKFVVEHVDSSINVIIRVYERERKKDIINIIFDYNNKQFLVCDDFGGHGFAWAKYEFMDEDSLCNKIAEILEQLGFVNEIFGESTIIM